MKTVWEGSCRLGPRAGINQGGCGGTMRESRHNPPHLRPAGSIRSSSCVLIERTLMSFRLTSAMKLGGSRRAGRGVRPSGRGPPPSATSARPAAPPS
eukprot:1362060-Rhodomonas_salina.2